MRPITRSHTAVSRLGWLLVLVYLALLLYPNLYLLGEPWNLALPGGRYVGSGRIHVLFVNLLLLLMLLAGVRRLWLAVLLLSPFFALLPAELFYMSRFGMPTHAAVVAVIAETDRFEAIGWLGRTGLAVGAWVVSALLAAWALAAWLYRIGLCWPGGRTRRVLGVYLPAIIGVQLLAMLAFTGVRGALRTERQNLAHAVAYRMGGLPRAMLIGYPSGVPLRVAEWLASRRAMKVIRRHTDGMAWGAARAPAAGAGLRREVYVMIVGESLRADHLQINGYGRATTPNLAGAKDLVSLRDFVSAASLTRLAVPPLFTRRLPQAGGLFKPEPSVLKAFKEAGFKTYWLTTQAPFGQHDAGISMVLGEVDDMRSVSSEGWRPGVYDGDLLPWLDEVMARDDEPRQLIVLHTRGSHSQYSLRYPRAFEHYEPAAWVGSAFDPWDTRQRDALVNAYDNSVRYTDWFVAQVMQRVEARTAQHGSGWLLFVSDHGETLFDDSSQQAGHGFASRSNYLPAAFFWPTQAYVRAHGREMAALRCAAGQATDYRVVFHTLLDLAAISIPVFDPGLSLVSGRYRPVGPRYIESGQGEVVEFDRTYPSSTSTSTSAAAADCPFAFTQPVSGASAVVND